MIRPRTLLTVLLWLGAIFLFSGFDIWLAPSGYQFKKGQACTIHFIQGQNFQGESWDLVKTDITRMDFYTLVGKKSLLPALVDGKKDNLTLLMDVEGTALLAVLQKDHPEFLSHDAFEQAIDDSGLTVPDIPDDSIPVTITRCSKLLLQVGDVSGSTFRNAVDLPLEIVPLNNPYLAKPGENMNFRLLFNGKPMEFTPLKVWNKKGERVLVQNIYTQKDGTMNTPLSNEGAWMVTAQKMVKSNVPGAGWQLYETSLQFGFGND